MTLVYAGGNPLDTIAGQTASEFKRLVEEKPGGSITIEVRDSGTLGAIQCVITDTAWAKLTPAQQAVIMEPGKEVQAFNQQLSQSAEDGVPQ